MSLSQSLALEYVKKGWAVVLLHGITTEGYCTCSRGKNCDKNMQGKHPLVGIKGATIDPGTVVAWFEKHPDSNIGITTGKPNKFIVLDVDPRNGGEESLQKMQQEFGELPVTLSVRTGGGGRHFYFRHPGEGNLVRTGNAFLGAGLDIKGDSKEGGAGGYVVAPPSKHASGNSYEWFDKDTPLADIPAWLLDLISCKGIAAVVEELISEKAEIVPEGHRHDYIASRAGKLHQANFSPEAILSAVSAENENKCKPPLAAEEVQNIVVDISKYEYKRFRLDDVGNGKRFVSQFGNRVIHCFTTETWYLWDGRYWAKDSCGQIYQYAKQVVETIHSEAATKSGDLASALASHARRSGGALRIKNMIEMSRTESRVAVRVGQLDSNRILLNCGNGTLNLESGVLKNHSPRDLITKITEVAYVPEAKSELWESFLNDTTESDAELLDFIQKVAGYSFSGLTEEENIFFIYGPGGTGKTTYIEAVKGVLGDAYCRTAAFSTFLKAGNIAPNAPRSDIARLAGARLVTAIEMAKGRQLAEDLLKAATGGDKLVTRGLYQSEFEFIPQYKLWLASNDKPRIREDDSGLWRRLLLVPFYHIVPPEKIDKKLKDKFRYDKHQKEAILAWAVEGFKKWRRDGLGYPKRVLEETKVYKSEMEPLTIWLEDCCVISDKQIEYTSFKSLWNSYEEWLQKQRAEVKATRIETTKAFALSLKARGLESGMKFISGRQMKVYFGIQVLI